MNALDLDRLFLDCPYPVRKDGEEYSFKTDYDIVYAVSFKDESFFSPIPAYWFDLMNRSHKASPNDPKVRETIIRIIVEFFRVNPDIMLYMCDTANDQQAQRNRLFLRWFSGTEQSKLFYIKTALIMDEGLENFIAIIVPQQHPHLDAIIERFNAEIEMFKSDKPQ
jgi:hypothetical protein